MVRGERILNLRSMGKCLVILTGLVWAVSYECNADDSIGISGHYEGEVTFEKGTSQNNPLVTLDVYQRGSSGKNKEFIELEVLDDDTGDLVSQIYILKKSRTELVLSIPNLFPSTILKKENTCYVGQFPVKMELCFNGFEVKLSAEYPEKSVTFKLTADRRVRLLLNEHEIPLEYTLGQALHVAAKRNLDSGIQFERALQARANADSYRLNLLPHLSISSLGILGAISDLIPFIFPNRWIQAADTSYQSQIENYALKIMRADILAQIEGLSYTLNKDKVIHSYYQLVIDSLDQKRNVILDLESHEKLSKGSLDLLDSAISTLKLDQRNLESLIQSDKVAISTSMGFVNPEAVEDVTIPNDIGMVETASPLESQTLRKQVLRNSYELKQMDIAVNIAKDQIISTPFQMFDPRGDRNAGLGLALFPIFENLNSKVVETIEKRIKTQQLLESKIYLAVLDYNSALFAYRESKLDFSRQSDRLFDQVSSIQLNSKVNIKDTTSAAKDYFTVLGRRESALCSYRIARAKIDRLMVTGVYK